MNQQNRKHGVSFLMLACAVVLPVVMVSCISTSDTSSKSMVGKDACQYFVAVNGNDNWSGKLARSNFTRTDGPFATITRARDVVRQYKTTGSLKSPVTVQIRGGKYYITETISFIPEDSGTKEYPVIYSAYPGEKPVLIGGRHVTGFKPGGGNVVTAVLPQVKDGNWFFRQLFVDGSRMIRARTPNYDPADPYRKGFSYVWKGASGFGQSVGNIHNPGDWMEYKIDVPAEADYSFWMLYGANNKPFGTDNMGGRTMAIVDGGTPIPLMNLPNTGGWNSDKWSCCATIHLTKGKHTLRWQNVKGGGLNIGGFALCDDPTWKPTTLELPKPAGGKHVVTISAEDFDKSHGKQLSISGNGAGIATAFRYKTGDIKPEWAQYPGAEIHIFQSASCRAFKEIVSLAKVDTDQNIVTVSGRECVVKLSVGDRYFVENIPDALDSPGEWYLDCKTGELRVWPAKPMTRKTEVVAPVVGRLFELKGDTKSGKVISYINFRGLQICDADYSPDDGCVGYQTGSDGAVYFGNATDCSIVDCIFRNVGKYAVCIKEGGNNRVVGNVIANGAEGGVVLLQTSGNEVTDNHIHDCGWVYKHVGGVILEGLKTSDNLIAHNLIHEIPRYGISLKNPGSRNVVEYNKLYNLSTETFDTGGIEVTQQDREFRSGSTIRYNIVHDVIGYYSNNGHEVRMSWAIYLDSFAGGYDVNNNITYRNSHGGVMLQGGKDNKVWNNILVDSSITQVLFANFSDNTRGNVFEHNIVYYTNSNASLFWASRVHEGVMTADNNLYWHTGTNKISIVGAGSFTDWQKRGFDVHSVVSDPLFVDPARDDYMLKLDSPAFNLGFKAIDISKIGIRKRH
ncbi:MAG: right-handed parallel beta-helix repeat-containing protein [Kiritimatiellae bacterium]|nr:right-handed parallel beta-helix repeat-containing protein [Kiritimatiellia bacterium]